MVAHKNLSRKFSLNWEAEALLSPNVYLRSRTIASEQFSGYHLNLRIVTKPVALPTLLKQALPEAVTFIGGRLLIY